LIGIDSTALLNSGVLPSSLDVALNNIAYKYQYDKRDYRFNPREGLLMNLGVTAGIKNIIENNRITDLKSETVDFSAAYDTLQLRAVQISTDIDVSYFIPLKKASTLMLGNKSGAKYNPTQVFNNELYRIGGSNILRGFDEESIRAQYYSIFTAEFRYLLSLNSYFSTFIDYGLTYNEFRESGALDFPLGFGVGLSFQTTAGIFGIDVALGREQGNPLDFRNTKTHFGFISLF
jgi:hemolysin activation/secretion protein